MYKMISSRKQYGSICVLIVLFPLTAAVFKNVETGICAGCDFRARSCKRPHPEICSKYIQCMEQEGKVVAVEFYCSWGLHWDTTSDTCDWPSKVKCKKDPCRTPGTPPYPYGGNCRGFWECADGYAAAKCCPPGQSFSKTTGCTADPKCDVNIPCKGIYKSVPVPTTTPIAGCPYYPADPTNNTFIGRGTLDVRSCGRGKIFDELLCSCIQVSNVTSVCEAKIDLEFNETDVNQLTTLPTPFELKKVDGKGVFMGYSSVGVWEFDNAPLGERIEISVKFFPFPAGPAQQVLASNCRTAGSNEPSVAIEIDRLASMVNFKGATENVVANISVPLSFLQWNEASWSLSNGTLTGTNTVLGVKSDNSAVLEGNLKMSTSPFKFGGCTAMVDGYYGLMKRITFYGCDPR